MEISKIFFDTNIVLDIMDSTRSGHKKAKKIWEISVVNKYQIVISEDMLSTVFYINKDKEYTLEFFQILYKRWKISPFGQDVIKKAIDISLKETLDLEDVLQCLCAKENGCKVLITDDKRFYDCGLRVSSVDDYLK